MNYNKDTGFEGSFVYGWDKTELVLIPTNSKDYIELQKYSTTIYNDNCIKAKDLIIGATYKCKDGSIYVYMGRYDTYTKAYEYENDSTIKTVKNTKDIPRINHGYTIPYKETYILDGPKYWFCYIGFNDTKNEISYYSFIQLKSIAKNKFITCIDKDTYKHYDKVYKQMEKFISFIPIDRSKDTFIDVNKRNFYMEMHNGKAYFISDFEDGKYQSYAASRSLVNPNLINIYKFNKQSMGSYGPKYIDGYNISVTDVHIDDLYDLVKPKKVQIYQENGNFLKTDDRLEHYYVNY